MPFHYYAVLKPPTTDKHHFARAAKNGCHSTGQSSGRFLKEFEDFILITEAYVLLVKMGFGHGTSAKKKKGPLPA